MTRSLLPDPMPDEVTDEAILVPEGETRYTFLFDDATVEQLAAGICSEETARRAHHALQWKREWYRHLAQETKIA